MRELDVRWVASRTTTNDNDKTRQEKEEEKSKERDQTPLNMPSLFEAFAYREVSLVALLGEGRHLRRHVDERRYDGRVVVTQDVHPHIFQLPVIAAGEEPRANDTRSPHGRVKNN